MLEYDEKRDYLRMNVECDLTYILPDSNEEHSGVCTSISGSGVCFIADQYFDAGIAMEIKILPKNALTPPMNAFIEVVRSTEQKANKFEIAATIKSLKGG